MKKKYQLNPRKDFIVVTGANGFTGRYVCKELLRKKIPFCVILRPGSDTKWINSKKIEVRFADLNDKNELSKKLYGFNIILNIASLGFGSAKSIIQACEENNLKRGIFISSTSIFTKLNVKSKKIRKEAENIVRESSLNWTILRPTMIYGTSNDRNMIKLIKWINKFPIIPIFGSGNYLQQPIHVEDVAWAVIEVINNKNCFMKEFNIGGANALKFKSIIEIVKSLLNKKCIQINLSHKLFIYIFKIFEKLNIQFMIKAEQIERLNENKCFSNEEAMKAFNFRPVNFEEGIKKEINHYKSRFQVQKKS